MSFAQFVQLNEANEQVLTHLTHLEDLPLFDSKAGAKRTLAFIKGMFKVLKGHAATAVNVSVKFDGSPSIICGRDPEDGKFFVATKSLFNKTGPKMVKSPSDVARLYGDAPGLAETLLTAWTLLKDYPWPTILQGDLLFTNNIKHVQQIDGEEFVVFQPNTIAYAVPVASDFGTAIMRAKLGIAFHTHYTGTSLRDLKMGPGADLSSMKLKPDVFLTSGNYKDLSGTITLTAEDSAFIQSQITALEKATDELMKGNRFLGYVTTNSEALAYFTRFQNEMVRQGKSLTGKQSADAFLEYMFNLKQADVAAKKSDKGKAEATLKFDIQFRNIQTAMGDLVKLFEWQSRVVMVKNLLLKKLNNANRFSAYTKTSNGFSPTDQEGFVAADKAGRLVKFVDRATFSRMNFLASKNRA